MKYIVMLLLVLHAVGSARLLDVSVSAQSAILINAETGKILFAKNIDDQHPPGSTTKIATCLVALQRVTHMDAQVLAEPECLISMYQQLKQARRYLDPPYLLEPDGTSYGIHTGEVLTIKDLLYGLMLSSGNDAANVLAYHFSQGDIPAYVEEMNRYVRSIGCRKTTFYNPHGLHYPGQLTTARDLAMLGREAIKHPQCLEIMSTAHYERPQTNKQAARTIWTSDQLLRQGKYYYPRAFGIKLGYHEAAGHVFVGAAKEGNRVLISAVMHAPSREEVFKDTIKLFETAFAEKKLARQLLNHQESFFTTQVKGTRQLLKAGLKEDLFLEYFPSEEEEVEPKLVFYDLTLPIERGALVGELQVHTDKGAVIKTAPVYAMEAVHCSLGQIGRQWMMSWRGLVSLTLLVQSFTGLYLYKKFWSKKAVKHVFMTQEE